MRAGFCGRVPLFGIILNYLPWSYSMTYSTMKTTIGSYSLHRQPRPKNRWSDPLRPEFDRNWAVHFYLLGQEKVRSAKLYPVCDRCRAEPLGVNPVESRPKCECHRAARRWAQAFLETETALLQAGELQKLEQLRSPKKWTPLREVLATYKQRGPADRVQRLRFLRTIYEQATGRELEAADWPELTRDLVMDWAELRQEAGRRGWLGQGRGKDGRGTNMPVHGWQSLRALKAAGELPALDDTTTAPWNTTILGHLNSAKSIFGDKSRSKVLRGLEIPELKEFAGVTLELPCPKGHKAIPAEIVARIEAGLERLREENPRVWLFFMLCDETGMRPVSVRRLDAATLTILTQEQAAEERRRMAKEWRVPEEELCAFGGLVRVPAAKHGNEVMTPVSAEVVAVAQAVMTAPSLIGARHVTEGRELHRALNTWLRGCGVTGTHAAYLLRHRKGQQMRRFGGKAAVGATLGHKGEAMADRYSLENRVVPAVGLRMTKGAGRGFSGQGILDT